MLVQERHVVHARSVSVSVNGPNEKVKSSVGWLQRFFPSKRNKRDSSSSDSDYATPQSVSVVNSNTNVAANNTINSNTNTHAKANSNSDSASDTVTSSNGMRNGTGVQRRYTYVDGEYEGMNGSRSTVNVQVAMLDGQLTSFEVDKTLLGNSLLRRVCTIAGLTNDVVDFFGLQIDSDRLRTWTWLNLERRVIKQLQKHGTLELQFQVRFYPPDTSCVHEEVLVYQLVLQVRQDVAKGLLRCPLAQLAQLAAYSLQSEVGDYNDYLYQKGSGVLASIPCINFAIKAAALQRMSIDRLLNAVHTNHKTLQGLMPAVSDYKFFERACKLQLYGLKLQSAFDARGGPIMIGADHGGVHVYQQDGVSLRRLNRLAWPRIMRIHYQSKRLYVEVRGDPPSSRNVEVVFRLLNAKMAKRAWKILVDSHIFYRLKAPRNGVKLARSQLEVNRTINSTMVADWKRSSSFSWWTQSAKSITSLQSLVSPKSTKVRYDGGTLYETRQVLASTRRSRNRYWSAEKDRQRAEFQSAPCLLPTVERTPSTRPLPPLPNEAHDGRVRLSTALSCFDDPDYAVIDIDEVGHNLRGDSRGAYRVTAVCRRDSQYSTIQKFSRRTNDTDTDHIAFSTQRNADTDDDDNNNPIAARQPSRETNIDDVDVIPYDF